jgi:FtsP/CotA-like multicopper oxidase with cupredoxin domain
MIFFISSFLNIACTRTTNSPPGHSIHMDSTGFSQDSADSGQDSAALRPLLTFPTEVPPSLTLTAQATESGYAYNQQLPGPTLAAVVGDNLMVVLNNQLDASTTLHWHGVKAPENMDGATVLLDPVAPNAQFTYSFPLTHPGTFWYHPHIDADHQVDLGLYGALIVRDPTDPPVDQDVVLVFDTVGETIITDEHGLLDPSTQEWSINGQLDPIWAIEPGQRVRARLINAATSMPLALSWPGARVIGGDQGLIAAETVDPLVLAPGDRAEVEVLSTGDVLALPYTTAGGLAYGEAKRLMAVEAENSEQDWADLEPPSEDPGTTDILWTLQGDYEKWLINGEIWPDVTIPEVQLGATIMI